MKIYFASNNEFKIKEAREILENIELLPVKIKIDEIQSDNAEKIVRDKVLKAFKKIRRPVFVEHTGLYLDDFGNLPGGLTQIVWDSLEADKFCDFFGNRSNTKAEAKTIIGYCDGKIVNIFNGSIMGNISDKPRGNRDFQWDCVFIPEGYDKTFAELGDVKNEISMRKKALVEFSKHVKGVC
jgi:XTP/dITP diphosphohydrolase